MTDDGAGAVAIEWTGMGLSVSRDAGISASFDSPIGADMTLDDGVRLWSDVATIEIEGDSGGCWIGVQHLLNGPTLALRVDSDVIVSIDVAIWSPAHLICLKTDG